MISSNHYFKFNQSKPANTGPMDVPRTSPSSVTRTFPKNPIWPSRGLPNLMSRGRPESAFQGGPWENVLRLPSEDLQRISYRDHVGSSVRWWWWWRWIVFVVWLTDERRLVLFPARTIYCQRSSPSCISDSPRAGIEPAQSLNSGLVEWGCAVVITTTLRRP